MVQSGSERKRVGEAPPVRLLPIADRDVPKAALFLHDHMNKRVSPAQWERGLMPSWQAQAPNHGFMLVAGDKIVGVQAAIYSQRTIQGEQYRFCNLAAWCVLEGYRLHSLRLLKAVLAQEGYQFTDLSPSGDVVPLNTRLNFQRLDTATALVLNLPLAIWARGIRIHSDRARIEATIRGRDLEIYNDHATASAAYHLVVTRGDESCYIVLRRDRRKNLPIFASLLHVGNPSLFEATSRSVCQYLLLRYGMLATLAEIRVVGKRPPLSVMLPSPRPKMFRSRSLRPEQIDYLYSELTCVAW
jgi:hypothetical protein